MPSAKGHSGGIETSWLLAFGIWLLAEKITKREAKGQEARARSYGPEANLPFG